MRKSIGEILNSKRRELGFSQSELAAALAKDGIDVTNQAISKWESGQSTPDLDKLLALSQCFGVTMDELIAVFRRAFYPSDCPGLYPEMAFQTNVRVQIPLLLQECGGIDPAGLQ